MDTSFQKTSASNEWYTPKEIIDSLGVFDLDPCAPMKPLWKTAERMINKEEDGLKTEWGGVRVFCNPPYSQPLLTEFCKRMAENGNGILLIFARTGNKCFQNVLLPAADAVLFMRHRVRFYLPSGKQSGSAGCDSCLMAFGKENVEALKNSGIQGVLLEKNGPWLVNTKCDLFD